MELYLKIIISAILLVLAVIDFRKKEIPGWLILILFLACIISRIILGIEWFSLITGISVGLVMLSIAFLTKEKVGLGDGLVVICLGIFLGGTNVIKTMLIASVIMTCISGIMLLMKKGKLETTLPFVPAILMGFLVI